MGLVPPLTLRAAARAAAPLTGAAVNARLTAALASADPHTLVLAGLGTQVSGKLAAVLRDDADQPYFIRFTGPTQLARGGRELSSQGPAYHRDGFSTPLGPLADGRTTADLGEAELQALRQGGTLTFASGVNLTGRLDRVTRAGKAHLVLTFRDCTITDRDGRKVLYRPSWGPFDLLTSRRAEFTSVEPGVADPGRYRAGLEALGKKT